MPFRWNEIQGPGAGNVDDGLKIEFEHVNQNAAADVVILPTENVALKHTAAVGPEGNSPAKRRKIERKNVPLAQPQLARDKSQANQAPPKSDDTNRVPAKPRSASPTRPIASTSSKF